MNKCKKCNNPVEYDIEGGLCGEHWARWMAFMDDDITPPETPLQKKLYREAMESVRQARGMSNGRTD